mgnify:CR=1 FL=1
MRNLILFVGLFLSVSCVNRHSIHHIRHICHTAVYALELQRVAMVTDSVTDTVTDFCQSCTYATASFYMHDVGSFTQWNSLFRPVEQIVSC